MDGSIAFRCLRGAAGCAGMGNRPISRAHCSLRRSSPCVLEELKVNTRAAHDDTGTRGHREEGPHGDGRPVAEASLAREAGQPEPDRSSSPRAASSRPAAIHWAAIHWATSI